MPKAAKTSRSRSARKEPTKATKKAVDPKASHLYADDNPATTIHGKLSTQTEAQVQR